MLYSEMTNSQISSSSPAPVPLNQAGPEIQRPRPCKGNSAFIHLRGLKVEKIFDPPNPFSKYQIPRNLSYDVDSLCSRHVQ